MRPLTAWNNVLRDIDFSQKPFFQPPLDRKMFPRPLPTSRELYFGNAEANNWKKFNFSNFNFYRLSPIFHAATYRLEQCFAGY
jgi:hypothetical protein